MHRNLMILVLLLAAAFTFGCAKGRTLAGPWKVDVDKQARESSVAMMPEDLKKKTLEDMSKGTFTFTKDNKMADLKFLRQDGDIWVLETTVEGGKKGKTTITWYDDNHIKMDLDGSPTSIYLTR